MATTSEGTSHASDGDSGTNGLCEEDPSVGTVAGRKVTNSTSCMKRQVLESQVTLLAGQEPEWQHQHFELQGPHQCGAAIPSGITG